MTLLKKKNITRIVVLLALTLWIGNPADLMGQKQNNIWYFGQNAGLDFTNIYPYPLTDGQINSKEGVASICDSTGQLLFYSDGITVWNKLHQAMPGGTDLMGDQSSTHAATIVPMTGNDKKYHLFTNGIVDTAHPEAKGLFHYLVDFTNNPLGEVIPQETEGLLTNPTEKLAAHSYTTSGGTESYRIYMHQFDNDSYAHASISKLDSLVYQAIGMPHSNDSLDDGTNRGAIGQMKFNLRGDRLAVAISGRKGVDIFFVNKTTGALSNHVSLPAGDALHKMEFLNDIYGLEFSPDSRILYGSTREGGIIYQWNVSNWNEQAITSRVFIVSADDEVQYGTMQLAPDDKIYISVVGKDYLSVIKSPMKMLADCRFAKYGARLTDNDTGKGGIAKYGLPVNIAGTVPLYPYYYENTCLGDVTEFAITLGSGFGSTPFWIIYDSQGNQVGIINAYYNDAQQKFTGSFIFPEPDTYRVVLTIMISGSPRMYTRYVTIHPKPEVHLAARDTVKLCIGESMHLDAGIGAFYEWEDTEIEVRERDITTTSNLLDLYRVKLTDYTGCVGWDTIWVWKKNPPVVDIQSTKALCGEDNGTITVTPSGNLSDYIFTWEQFPDSTGSTLKNLGPGMYSVYVHSIPIGCGVTKEIEVKAFGGSSISMEASDSTICPGDTIILQVKGANEIIWINPQGATDSILTLIPEQSETYQVIAINRDEEGNVCETPASLAVEMFTVTPPVLDEERSACEGEIIEITAQTGYTKYEWSNGMSGQTIQLTEPDDNLVLTVTDIHQCTSQDNMRVFFFPAPEVDLGEDQSLCTNEPITLSGGSGDQYLWSTTSTDAEISVTTSDEYWLEITKDGCKKRDTVLITIYNPDLLTYNSVNTRDVSCFGGADGEIEISVSGEGTVYKYSINEGIDFEENGGLFTGLKAGDNYWLVVWEDSSCRKAYPDPIVINEPDSISFKRRLTPPECLDCNNGAIEITLIEGGTPPYLVSWSNGITGMIIDQLSMGEYTVTITDHNGCEKSEYFNIDVKFAIPNAFTPNGDNVNDLWTIQLLFYYPDATVKVFDTFGKTVYESPHPAFQNPWDGNNLEGDPVPLGTYYYIIQLDPTEKPLTGHLTVLR